MSWYNVVRGLTAAKYYCTHKRKDDRASDGGEVGTVRKAWKCLLAINWGCWGYIHPAVRSHM